MFSTIEQFKKAWKFEKESTERIIAALTDESLGHSIIDGHWNIGQLSWHIVTTIPEMMGKTGLSFEEPGSYDATVKKAADISKKYSEAANKLMTLIGEKWDDKTLLIEDDMYGERWNRGETLGALIGHQTHHRGQLTVLMRQAGLKVPGIYGPSKEEWAQYGMKEPVV